jgi:hypothetical protein
MFDGQMVLRIKRDMAAGSAFVDKCNGRVYSQLK